jgi:hypothetical protein
MAREERPPRGNRKRRGAGSQKIDAFPDPEDMTLSYAQWCKERGFDPITHTYKDEK